MRAVVAMAWAVRATHSLKHSCFAVLTTTRRRAAPPPLSALQRPYSGSFQLPKKEETSSGDDATTPQQQPPEPEPEPQWLLVDGYNVMYRAYYAMPSLTNGAGAPIGAILGTCNMLMKVALPYARRGANVVFCVDAPGASQGWRKDLDPGYKATRARMPEALREQIDDTKRAAEAFGARIVVVPGQEADDVIATLAQKFAGEGVDVWSSDKDLLQLLAVPGVRVLDKDGVASTAEDVKRAFGVGPSQIADYLALVGDKADNVQGVPGIGPKTAAKFLDAFGTLDEVLAHGPSSTVAGAAKRKLLGDADKDAIALARRLVELDYDVPLPPEESGLLLSPGSSSGDDDSQFFDWDRLLDIADRYQLHQFKARVTREKQKDTSSS